MAGRPGTVTTLVVAAKHVTVVVPDVLCWACCTFSHWKLCSVGSIGPRVLKSFPLFLGVGLGVEVDHASFDVISLGPGSMFTGQSPEVTPRAWLLS